MENYCDRCGSKIDSTAGVCYCPNIQGIDPAYVTMPIVIAVSKIQPLIKGFSTYPEDMGDKINECVYAINQIIDYINSKI